MEEFNGYSVPSRILDELRRTNKERSLKVIVARIRRVFRILNEGDGRDGDAYDPDLLDDADFVTETLVNEVESINSLEALYRVVMMIVRMEFTDGSEFDKVLIEEFADHYKEIREKHRIIVDFARLNKKETDNWMKFDDVLKLRERYISGDKKDTISTNRGAFNYFLLALYTEIPPLRGSEYINMKFGDKDDEVDDETNIFDIENRTLVIRNHKTVKTHGIKVIRYKSDILHEAVLNWRSVNDSDRVVPLSSATLKSRFYRIFKPKMISTNMLRKIYTEHTKSFPIDEQRKIAKIMGHTMRTHKARYEKYFR